MSAAQTEKQAPTQPAPGDDRRTIKCVIWDLDETLWDGILLESKEVVLKPGITDVIRTLDERGILQSVASRNDHELAMAKLRAFGLAEYFLYPQIHWQPKSQSVAEITKLLNIGADSVAFIDDQPFERDEVLHSLPKTLCLDATALDGMLDLPEMNPRFVTDESRMRRRMYQSDIQRKQAEDSFVGASQEFLASLDMRMAISPASEGDLQRAEELTLRTNQLNTTGYTYSYDELNAFRRSPDHELLIASLEDRYGTYGKIGLSLIERQAGVWICKLLLMSCRVMSRGVGAVLINHIRMAARDAGVSLRAEFIENDRNRQMYITYKMLGFRELARDGKKSLLEANLKDIPPHPPFIWIGPA